MDQPAPVRGSLPHERRVRVRRWVVGLLAAAVFLVPVSTSTSCASTTTTGTCETTYAPLAGLVLGYGYPSP
ncbi:hypothetical protein [Demequina sp. NBRC 110056]|uniref:hypothetical protein n=1 Tax=Demequina sp. NBRC 110056 TaxID=1570345 RepID=UPI001180D76F|nr:hypothetical protein [Demequina sp. NBRC 110056]